MPYNSRLNDAACASTAYTIKIYIGSYCSREFQLKKPDRLYTHAHDRFEFRSLRSFQLFNVRNFTWASSIYERISWEEQFISKHIIGFVTFVERAQRRRIFISLDISVSKHSRLCTKIQKCTILGRASEYVSCTVWRQFKVSYNRR